MNRVYGKNSDLDGREILDKSIHRVLRGVSTPKISNIEKVGIFDTGIHVGFTWHTQFFPL